MSTESTIHPASESTEEEIPEISTPGASSAATKPPKPRARLGPTEIVQLPGSDSEPEDGDETAVEEDNAEPDDNLLSNFPDDADVSIVISLGCGLI